MASENIFLEQFEIAASSLGLKQMGFEIDAGDATLSTMNYKSQAGQELEFIPSSQVDIRIQNALSSVNSGVYVVVTTESELTTALQSALVLNIWCEGVALGNGSANVTATKRIYSSGVEELDVTGSFTQYDIVFPTSGASAISIDFYAPIIRSSPVANMGVSGGFGGSPVYQIRVTYIRTPLVITSTNVTIQYEVNDADTPQDASSDFVLWSGSNAVGKETENTSIVTTRNLKISESSSLVPTWGKVLAGDASQASSIGIDSQFAHFHNLLTTATADREMGMTFGAFFDPTSATDWREDNSVDKITRTVLTWEGDYIFYSGVANGSGEVTWTEKYKIDHDGNTSNNGTTIPSDAQATSSSFHQEFKQKEITIVYGNSSFRKEVFVNAYYKTSTIPVFISSISSFAFRESYLFTTSSASAVYQRYRSTVAGTTGGTITWQKIYEQLGNGNVNILTGGTYTSTL